MWPSFPAHQLHPPSRPAHIVARPTTTCCAQTPVLAVLRELRAPTGCSRLAPWLHVLPHTVHNMCSFPVDEVAEGLGSAYCEPRACARTGPAEAEAQPTQPTPAALHQTHTHTHTPYPDGVHAGVQLTQTWQLYLQDALEGRNNARLVRWWCVRCSCHAPSCCRCCCALASASLQRCAAPRDGMLSTSSTATRWLTACVHGRLVAGVHRHRDPGGRVDAGGPATWLRVEHHSVRRCQHTAAAPPRAHL